MHSESERTKYTFFLRNVRDCGQMRKELWLCVNGGIKMRDMIITAYSVFVCCIYNVGRHLWRFPFVKTGRSQRIGSYRSKGKCKAVRVIAHAILAWYTRKSWCKQYGGLSDANLQHSADNFSRLSFVRGGGYSFYERCRRRICIFVSYLYLFSRAN